MNMCLKEDLLVGDQVEILTVSNTHSMRNNTTA